MLFSLSFNLLSESRHLEQAATVKSVVARYWPALAASLAEHELSAPLCACRPSMVSHHSEFLPRKQYKPATGQA